MALHSHLQNALASAYLTLYYVRPQLAQAARAERRARRQGLDGAAGAASASSPGSSYAPQLGTAYLLSPVLALIVWRTLAPVVPGSAAALVGALLLLLPPLIHVAHGATARAGLALVSLVGYTALGSVSGAALGRTWAMLSCSAETHDECGLTVLGGLLLGAVVGGLLGYGVHGVRQVRAQRRLQQRASHCSTALAR